MLAALAMAAAISCLSPNCVAVGWRPTVVMEKPPCGTPEAKKEGACTQWVVRRAPVQPADEWPPYEEKSGNLLHPRPPEMSVSCCSIPLGTPLLTNNAGGN